MPMFTQMRARLLNQPLLAEQHYLEVLLSSIADRLEIEPMVSAEIRQSYTRPARYNLIDRETGTAVIPVVGGMVHRSEGVNPPSGLTGYTALQNLIAAEVNNGSSRAILLDADTPGGEVGGLSELASFIAEANKEKPIYVIANTMLASAGYWMASGARRIYAAPGSMTGSIGVITAHVDRSEELKRRGQVVTLIHAGARKADGNPYAPLPPEVRDVIGARIDALYTEFVQSVAEARGIDEAVVRKTEAGVFSPAEAKELGLVDGVATLGETLRAIGSMHKPLVQGYSATNEDKMKESLIYGESDLAAARADGQTKGVADAQKVTEKAIAAAVAATTQQFTDAIAALFPENERAEMFADALAEGSSVPLAAKLAGRVKEAPKADASKTRTDKDVDALMERHAADVDAGDTDPADKRAARLAEIGASAKSYNRHRGYAT